MFGRMFQHQGLPSAYRRVAWLQSDGVAYINLDYVPIEFFGGNASRFNISLRYPSSSTTYPGMIFGASTAKTGTWPIHYGMTTKYGTYTKIPDSGTVTAHDPYYECDLTVNYARDKNGVFSGTIIDSGMALPSNGLIPCMAFDEETGESWSYTIYPPYPTQPVNPNPYAADFAMAFRHGVYETTTADFEDVSTSPISHIVYSNAQVTIQLLGTVVSSSVLKYSCRVEAISATFGSKPTYTGGLPVCPIFLFANDYNGLPASYDTNVKVDAFDILEYKNSVTSVIRKLVACVRKRDEKPGMYDLKNHRFFTNAADTGEFLFAELTD